MTPSVPRLAGFRLSLILVFASSAASAQSASSMAGGWVGAYLSGPSVVTMRLQLAQSGDAMQGELRLEPLNARQGTGALGVVAVTARYNATARTLEIVADPAVARQIGFVTTSFTGVFDESSGMVAGMLTNAANFGGPYFVLGRSNRADDQFLKPLRNALKTPGPSLASRTTLGRAAEMLRGSSVDQNKLREWASKLLAEYPNADLRNMQIAQMFHTSRPLFRDDHFKKYFGKTYDEFDTGELQRIGDEMRKFPVPRSNFPEEQLNGVVHTMQHAFAFNAAADITLGVIAMRVFEDWRSAAAGRLESLGGAADAMDAIAAIERAEPMTQAVTWPSERPMFAAAVTQGRSRVAAPSLVAQVDQLLASARSFADAPSILSAVAPPAIDRRAGRVGIVPAGQAAPSAPVPTQGIPALLALVSEDVRSAQRTRLETKLDELLATETAADRAAIPALGTGPEGLAAGTRWHAQTVQKYAAFATRPQVASIYTELGRHRSTLLRASETALSARITAAASTAAVNTTMATYLGVPTDRNDPTGARLVQVAQTRQGALAGTERAEAQQRAAENTQRQAEAREAASACARVPADDKEVPAEPSSRDMCRAIEAVLTGQQENLKEMQTTSCTDAQRDRNDMMAGLFCMAGQVAGAGGGPQLSLRGFRKIACVAATGRPGFSCDYVLDIASNNAMMRSTLDRFGAELVNARFVRMSGGSWLYIPPGRQ